MNEESRSTQVLLARDEDGLFFTLNQMDKVLTDKGLVGFDSMIFFFDKTGTIQRCSPPYRIVDGKFYVPPNIIEVNHYKEGQEIAIEIWTEE